MKGNRLTLYIYPTPLHSVLPAVLMDLRNGAQPRSYCITIRKAVYGLPRITALGSSMNKTDENQLGPFHWPLFLERFYYYRFLRTLNYSLQFSTLRLWYFKFIRRLLKVIHEGPPFFIGDH
jgi:hypothetical protein